MEEKLKETYEIEEKDEKKTENLMKKSQDLFDKLMRLAKIIGGEN